MTTLPAGVLEMPAAPDPVALYARLLADARASGRSPVWLDTRYLDRLGGMAMPADPVAEIDAGDAETVLAAWWPGPCPPGCSCLEPFTGAFPRGLVRVGEEDRSQRPGTVAQAVEYAAQVPFRPSLAVIDAARPADVPAAIVWSGMCNYWFQDLVGLCTVLRSWEERFGATLVCLSGATMLLAVADPPESEAECERVAAEHFAFCPDQRDPQDARGTVYTPGSYARTIRGARHWRFWWD